MKWYIASSQDEYVPQMKKIYTIDTEVIDGVDWVLVIGGGAVSVLSVAGLVYWLYNFFLHLFQASRGEIALWDNGFWKRSGVALLIIFLLLGGIWLTIFEELYNTMVVWGWKTE